MTQLIVEQPWPSRPAGSVNEGVSQWIPGVDELPGQDLADVLVPLLGGLLQGPGHLQLLPLDSIHLQVVQYTTEPLGAGF